MLTYNEQHKLFLWYGTFDQRVWAERAGFTWHNQGRCWVTPDPYKAFLLHRYWDLNSRRDNKGLSALTYILRNIQASSRQDEPPIPPPAPEGNVWYPFQAAGVWNIAHQLTRRNAVLLADEPGLGKTCQAIGVANIRNAKKILTICPASLRLNWARELNRWHMNALPAEPILTKSSSVPSDRSIITSYNLTETIKDYQPDLIVVDECHYIKNTEAKRTQWVLGNMLQKWPGIVNKAPTIYLSGTPKPNGRPNEIWPLLYKSAPDVINRMTRFQFMQRFCTFFDNGEDLVVTGAKNEPELFTRLRGSGFMTRRLKKDVLKDLPPVVHKMVVFPATGNLIKVLKKEAPFSAEEIIAHGVPVGSALPEIRREMGIEKVPYCVNYITDMLQGGVEKVVVFVHHREVLEQLFEAMIRNGYNTVFIYGGVSPRAKQDAVDMFQTDPTVRVFIGNQAAEEGWTLTAAKDVVLAEPEWVPGQNKQRVDRTDRIGQFEQVTAHWLVVENSLDARILGDAAAKQDDVHNVLDRPNYY